jgi:hypothetical protein
VTETGQDSFPPPFEPAVPISEIQGDEAEDTTLLREMAESATRYVHSFPWFLNLKAEYFADGIGGIVAIFLFCVDVRRFKDSEWIWVYIGDIPSAYFSVDSITNPYDALAKYIDGLEEWVQASERGQPTEHLIPIKVPEGAEYIEMLKTRILSFRELILPNIRRD